MIKVDLRKYNNDTYQPGNIFKRTLWYLVDLLFFKTYLPFPSNLKVRVLHLFGAKIGRGVVIKPNVNIKYPWFLSIGDNCWIGEDVWIDDLAEVVIGDNVVLSQGAYLLTGSHDYKKVEFDLILQDIRLDDGVWIGAKAIVCPGVRCKEHSVLAVGSVATRDLEAYGVYQGNPARFKRNRIYR